MWILTACLSAIFAGATSVLAKVGIKKTDSDVATAIRTGVVLIFSWVMVFIVGSQNTVGQISGRSAVFLVLSGAATGFSWITYYKALSLADVNKVAPIDKSSTVLSVIFAMVLFNETSHLAVKIAGMVLITAGTYLMIDFRHPPEGSDKAADRRSKVYILYAAASAVFAALTSILAKIGIDGVESNLGTAVRTGVVLVISWGIVLCKGKIRQVAHIGGKEWAFILLSGAATGVSWLCYFNAIQTGIVSVVVPIDKLSILVTVAFSCIFLKEKLTVKTGIGLALITAGTVLMAVFP